jgi:hypothetical protein
MGRSVLDAEISTRLILSLSKDEAPASLMVRQAHHEAALHG